MITNNTATVVNQGAVDALIKRQKKTAMHIIRGYSSNDSWQSTLKAPGILINLTQAAIQWPYLLLHNLRFSDKQASTKPLSFKQKLCIIKTLPEVWMEQACWDYIQRRPFVSVSWCLMLKMQQWNLVVDWCFSPIHMATRQEYDWCWWI